MLGSDLKVALDHRVNEDSVWPAHVGKLMAIDVLSLGHSQAMVGGGGRADS